MVSTELTAQQERFCQEYLVDLCGTRAAEAAGYSKKTAAQQASRLLSQVKIQERVAQLKKARADRLQFRADTVLQELARIAFANTTDVINVDVHGTITVKSTEDLPENITAAIKSITDLKDGGVKITFHSKTKALKLLGEHFDLFTEDSALKDVVELVKALQADIERKADEKIMQVMNEIPSENPPTCD